MIKAPELLGESVLSLESNGNDLRRLALTSAVEDQISAGAMAVVPSSLDEDTAGMGIARLGNRATTFSVTGGMFRGHEPKVRHEASWRREASDVIDLGQEGQGGQTLDTPETHERIDGGTQGNCLCVEFEFGIQGMELGLEVLEMFQIDGQSALKGAV